MPRRFPFAAQLSRLSPVTRVAVIVSVVLIGVLIVAVPGVGYAAYSAATSELFPAGTSVGGVDISGKSRQEATEAVRAHVEERLDERATVRVGKRTYTITPRELGADAQVENAIGQAVRQAQETSWWSRLTGTADGPDVPLRTSSPSKAQIRELVHTMVREAHVTARDADLDLVGGVPQVTPAKPGWRVRPKAATKALHAALESGGTHAVRRLRIEPDVTAAAYDTVIVIDDGTNVLRLYKEGELAESYSVAMGMPGHRTPHGTFEVTLKRPSPTWINPDPKGWGKDMPKRIGPGPDNPLGLRALNLSAPGIRIHGTSATSSIGQDASHGCIRLANSQILDLYPQVPTGATVFILE